MKTLRRLGRVVLISSIVVLSLLLTLMIVVQIPVVQTKIASYVVTELNETFETKINVDRVDIDFFGDINLYGLSAEDDHALEFIQVKRLEATLSIWGIIRHPDRITIKKLKLHQPKFKIITYKDAEESNLIQLINKFSQSEKEEKSDFLLRGAIEINDGELLLRNENLEGYKQDWVDATKLFVKIDDFKLENEEIWGNIKRLNFIGKRNGEIYNVKKLTGNVHYGKQEIRVDELKLITSDSYLNGYLKLQYQNTDELKDFADKVVWDAEFKDKSRINFKDVRYFVPDFDKNSTIYVIGKVDGTLNDMRFSEMQLSSGQTLLVAKNFNLVEMTNGDMIQIHTNNAKIKTSYQQLVEILPTFIHNKIPDFVQRFGEMDYTGDFDLNPTQINLDGSVLTALGDADLVVKLENYRSNLTYSGTLTADDINLKQISEVDQLGFVDGKVKFSGSGTDIKNLKLTADGTLNYLDLLGNRYTNIHVDGLLSNQKFEGLINVNDPNVNLNYRGIFDFSKQPYRLDFVSDVRHLNLDHIGLTKNLNAKIRANIDGDFSFSNIDDFLGKLAVNNLHFTSKTDTIHIPQATLVSNYNQGIHNLELDIPNYLKGEIHGQFRLSQLPDAIMNSIGENTLLSYKRKPISPNQNFSFFFEVEQDLFSLIDPRIQIAPGTIIDGQVDGNSNSLVAELSSTEIGFDGINVYNPLINIDTSKDTEPIYIRTDSLNAKGTMVYNLDLYTTPIQDSLLIKSTFRVGKEFGIDFDLNLYHTLDEQKNLVFGFSPSTITVDENVWFLNPNNETTSNRAIVNFDKNFYELQNILLESEGQKMLLDGYYRSNTDYKLNADLEQLVLSKLIPKGLLGELEIDGIATGKIDITRNKNELKPLTEFKIDSLSLNKYELGNLYANGGYNVDQNVFDVEMYLNQKQVQVLYVNGYIDNKTETPEINLFASLDDFNFKFIEAFLSAAMQNIRGKLSGEMTFKGPIDSPEFEGMLDINNLGFTVGFLNVDYAFDGTNTVPVYKASGGQGSITLDEIHFRDTKYNTKGEVSGQILFRDFASWFLNLSFNTNNLLVMNTNIKHNDLFYGKVFGQGAFELFGPPQRLDISAKATINEGSEFTVNTGATKVESESALVRFIPEVKKEEVDTGPKGMNIDLDITATPSSTVNIIFDPQTNDMVTANGYTKNLKFNLSRTGAITMDGSYTLESGEYQLRQIPLLNRDFKIQNGSFVRWNNGSPFESDLNIVANYERTVSNVGEYLGAGYSQIYDVLLGIHITESLKNPQMDFTLDIPKAGSDVQSMVDYKFNLDPDEKMVQFGSILLFGQFNTNSESILSAGAASTGAGIALKQLAGVLNSLLTGGVSIGVDYVQGSELSNTSDQVKTNLKIDLSPRWTFNGAVGLAVGNTYQGNAASGEAEMQWDISKNMDKSIVLNFFTRPTTFGMTNAGQLGNFQSFGAGIVYKTSFDKVEEIFQKKENTPTSVILRNENKDEEPEFDWGIKSDSTNTKENSEKSQNSSKEKDTIKNSKPVSNNKNFKKNSLVRFK